MRFLGLILSATAFFLLLIPAALILDMDDAKRTTMTLFYLSIPLTLVLSYIFSAAGRAENLATSPGGPGLAGRMQSFGFPLGHRHAWGDFGRLYALFFLCFIGPLIPAAFATLITSGLIGFEQTVVLSEDGSGLSESEAMVQIADGQIALEGADVRREARVNLIRDWAYTLGLLAFLPLLVRLIPFYFWRSGGRVSPTLAETWRRVGWASALLFGFVLFAGLAASLTLPIPLIGRYIFATIFIAVWALLYAKRVGPYDPR